MPSIRSSWTLLVLLLGAPVLLSVPSFILGWSFGGAQAKELNRLEIEKLLRQHPTDELFRRLGEVEEKEGNYTEAVNAFRQAVLLDPSEENLNALGSELLVHIEVAQASETFQRGTQKYPGSARMWVGLSVTLYARSQYAAAVQTLLRATDLRPEDPRPYFFLANAYVLAPTLPPGEGDHVIKHMGRLMKSHPLNPQAIFYYARCLWKEDRERGKQEDLPQVESLLIQSAQLDPSFPGVHLYLGILYQSEGRNDEATQTLQKAIKLNPNLAVAHYRLAQVYVQAHEKALADQEFQAYERLHSQTTPQDEQEGTEIGRFLSSMKTPESKQ
jgi:tetratricopeptide (TPR) repeat protein